MKLFMLILIILASSCGKKGEITQEPTDFIKIYGKVYKLMKIVPADNEDAIWIMYPKDSADKQPEIINYQYRSGKVTVPATVIEIQ